MPVTKKLISFPPSVVDNLRELGRRMVVARKIQRLRQDDLAAMAGISRSTLAEIEKGSPFVAIGNYMAVLWSLGIMSEILAHDLSDEEQRLVASELPQRVRNG